MFEFLKRNKEPQKNDNIDAIHIEEIKNFFFRHNGDEMGMWKCDEGKYEQYRTVNKDIVEMWRQELIKEKFDLLSTTNTDKCWTTVRILMNLIGVSQTYVESNYERLLNQITEIAPFLDKCQRILILEHFGGRTYHQKDGAIYKILNKTNLADLLKKTISILSDFLCTSSDNINEMGWEDISQRFDKAKSSVQKAFLMFQKNNPFE